MPIDIDLVLHNARINTQAVERPSASSLAIHAGRVLAIDPDRAEVRPREVVDAGGRTVVPGFIDAHAHSVWFGLTLMEADLTSARTLDEVYVTIGDAAGRVGPDDWVVAAGYSPLLVGGRQPDRDALDSAAGGRPVWIKHASGHACNVNGVGLGRIEASGRDLSAVIEGGVVVTDDAGRPTGLLEETAMSLVRDLMVPYPLTTLVKALDLATAHYLTEGLTSVTDCGVAGGWIGYSPWELGAYQAAREAGVLRTRMQPMVVLDVLHPIKQHASEPGARGIDGGLRTGFGDDWLSLGPLKIFSDGSLFGGTAYMTREYDDCPGNHGYLQMAADELRRATLEACAGGWSIAMHAIGDAAIDEAISILGEAQRLYGRRTLPHRIEHGGLVRPDQVEMLAAAGIAVVPQPYFITQLGDGMRTRLGDELVPWSYPAKSLLDHGLPVPGSSDRPVAHGRPLDIMQSFVERLTPSGFVYGPDERLTAAEALTAYTTGSAAVTGTAASRGRLAPGHLADLVILDADPTEVPSHQIGAVQVVATMVGGEVRHGADAL